jgi:hypothetical protein
MALLAAGSGGGSRSESALLRVEMQRLRMRVSRTAEDAGSAARKSASAEVDAIKSELQRRDATTRELVENLAACRKMLAAEHKAKWKLSQVRCYSFVFYFWFPLFFCAHNIFFCFHHQNASTHKLRRGPGARVPSPSKTRCAR